MKDTFFRLWFADTDARIYAAFRLCFATVALLNLCNLLPYRHAFFADSGLVDLAAAHAPGHFGMPHFSLFNVMTTETQVDLIFAVSAVAMVLLAAGVFARTAAFWVFIWHLTITYRSPVATAGWDDILRVYAFLVLISPLGARWPFRTAKRPLDPAPVYGVNLMRLQLIVIYLHTAMLKFPSEAWRSGDFLSYYLMSTNAQWPAPAVAEWQGVLKVVTWGALAAEVIIPVMLLIRRARLWGVMAGMAFHFAIFVVSRNLGLFCLTMWILYIPMLDPRALSWIDERRMGNQPER